MSSPSAERNPVDELAEEFARRWRSGERPSVSEYAQKYPELADQIRDVFPALVVMEHFKPASADLTGAQARSASDGIVPSLALRACEELPSRRLGEYRILREVGRGGMGIVYEAVQETLGRHVALKVLPPHALARDSHLERFRREARAAGRLHHTNIVPVFGTGECDGVHYYAMQFIPGQGLDCILDDLRHLGEGRAGGAASPAEAGVARKLLTGVFVPATAPLTGGPSWAPTLTGRRAARGSAAAARGSEDSTPGFIPKNPLGVAGIEPRVESSEPGAPSPRSELSDPTAGPYWRSVARVGLQVAEALAYAHCQGVVHRDIKPSNQLLDPQGTVWVTDFGLAKADDVDGLTGTGDVVGTLRYMAPERFDGISLPQGDVYSLGLTLYEMVTLRPAFDDSNRGRLVQKVLREAPAPPRQLDPSVPRDLETVVMKCLHKEPQQRYQSAGALAEDLRRFLADQPILARRASRAECAWRWCRRNPVVAGLSAALLLLLVAVSIGSVLVAVQFREQRDEAVEKERQAEEAKERAEKQQQRAEEAEQQVRRYLELMELYRSALPDPAGPRGLEPYRGKNGRSYHFLVTAWPAPSGPLWGTDVYSDDSSLGAAAVHAGILRPGEAGVVKVTILPGRGSYRGSTRHGMRSVDYEAWSGSFRIEAVPGLKASAGAPVPPPPPALLQSQDNPNLMGFRGRTAQNFFFNVAGEAGGPLWGTDVYTDDSSLGAAAVHAGILRPGEAGVVKVTILPGRASYRGSVRNGVRSSDYEAWDGSFRIEAAGR